MNMKSSVPALAYVVGAILGSSLPAVAVPFSTGSFVLTFQTDTTSDLDSAFTVFHLTGGSFTCTLLNGGAPCFDVGASAGDFASVAMPSILVVDPSVSGSGYNLSFGIPSNFNWDTTATGTDIGKFLATSISFQGHASSSPNAVVNWNVAGNFTVGAEFDNAGTVFTAIETWSLTQTGGGGQTISASGTFFAPDTITVPEPASLAILGAGLLGAGIAGRRRKAKKV